MARGVALINIVLGVFGLLALPCSGLVYLDDSSSNPLVQVVRSDALLLAWTLGSMTFGALLMVVQIVASAALLKGQTWSRWALLGQASSDIFSTLLALAVHGLVVTPRVLQIVDITGATPKQFGALGGLLGGSIGGLFSLVLPILTLIVITRPETIAALRASETPSVGPYPPSL